jgi:hypothetical protein
MEKLVAIYDDLLTLKEIEEYENLFLSNYFPWYLQESTVPREKDFPFMCHNFFKVDKTLSDNMPIAVSVLTKFIERSKTKYSELIRAQANLTFPKKSNNHSTIHIDDEKPHHVLIYYVLNSDGNTIMFENNKIFKEIEPKKGRFVLFDGSINHAQFTCSEKRIVINYNLQIPQ